MLNLQDQLGPDQYSRLMRGVARGKYQLLLGAGASATSHDQYGDPLPSGLRLRDEIAEDFNLPPAADKSLKRVYQLAHNRRSRDGRTMAEYLRDRFTNTKPAPWYEDLLRMQWAGLWTLNIDDCVERASTQFQRTTRQNVISISWTEKHRQADLRRDEVLLVHLHGKASRANKDNELIFDIATYLNAYTEQHRWLKIFGDEFPAKPFIAVGTSFDEEIDLQNIIEEGRPASDYPSLIILRSIDEFQHAEYKGYGLSPVRATAEEFFAAVRAALPEFLNELAPDETQELSNAPVETVRFLSQWRPLNVKKGGRFDARHDLYQGHEPRWSDAIDGLISTRDVIKGLTESITARKRPGEHAIVLLEGESFSGKSALFLRTARDLVGQGYQPYLFNKEETLDIEAIVYWTRRYPKTVLLIDDAADFALDVSQLIEALDGLEVSLRLLLVGRTSRASHLQYQLSAFPYKRYNVPAKLSNFEVSRLVELLDQKRRLGVLTTLSKSDRWAYFARHNNKLFSAMAELEGGRGFQQRVTEEFDRATAPAARRLLAVVGLASRLGYGLPLDVVKKSIGVTAAEADRLVQEDLGDLVYIEDGNLLARHRIFGELLFRYLSKEERSSAVTSLALAIAPHVSPEAISLATVYYRLVRALMGRALLLELLDKDRLATLAIFEEIEDAYSWNARFWEQRALIASEAGQFEKAFSWAQQAVAKKEDEKSLTTLGVVLMQRALSEASSGAWPTSSFEHAERVLNDARRMEGKRAEFPIETFFRYTIRIVRKVPLRDAALNNQLASLWQNWFANILTLDTSSQTRLARFREEVLAAWIEMGFERAA